VIGALQALRGVSLIAALGIAAELEDISRFGWPERLMSCAGLVPSSRSIRHRGAITKTGSNHLRWLLIEASLALPPPSRCGAGKWHDGLPEKVKRIAWKT